jgi:BED zinc finger
MAAFVATTTNRSFIWNFFTVCERDSSRASCNKCKSIISCGKTVTTFSTKPLINLSSLHPVEYKAFTQQTDAKASAVQHQLSAHTASGPKQLTVDESFGQMKP